MIQALCQAAAEGHMQPAEAGEVMWLQCIRLCTDQGCHLLGVFVSDATAWEVGRGDAWQECNSAAALALPNLRQGMQGQVDQQRMEFPAPCTAFHHGNVIVHNPRQDLEGSARLLPLYPCL